VGEIEGEAKTNASASRQMKCRNTCEFLFVLCDVERQTPHIFESNMFDHPLNNSAVFQNLTFDLFAYYSSCELFICVAC
jgi:hypothetical protein